MKKSFHLLAKWRNIKNKKVISICHAYLQGNCLYVESHYFDKNSYQTESWVPLNQLKKIIKKLKELGIDYEF